MKRTAYSLTLMSALCIAALTACSSPPSDAPSYTSTSKRSTSYAKPTTLSAYPGHVLKSGSRGPDVTALQAKLDKLGYSKSPENGNYTSATTRAVESFQRSSNLQVNGEVGRLTWNKLFAKSAQVHISQTSFKTDVKPKSRSRSTQLIYPNIVLQIGSHGKYVKSIQARLKTLGYMSGTADGVFGSQTASSVMSFQKTERLASNGKVNRSTWKMLFSKSKSTDKAPAGDRYPNLILKIGSHGPATQEMQSRLIKLAYLHGTADGDYGSETFDAVLTFQKMNKLAPSGQVDYATWTTIFTTQTPFKPKSQSVTKTENKIPASQKKTTSNTTPKTGAPPVKSVELSAPTNTSSETVAVFGGSMTYGYRDPADDSFVERAFASNSAASKTNYTYLNYAIPGYTAQRYAQDYPEGYQQILKQSKPQVVVLAWGLENDMSSMYKDSVATFGQTVKQEVSEALAAHSVVLLVTPPVTQLLATTDHQEVESYINELFQIGASFNSPNVVNIDVYHEMTSYMQAHNQTYQTYLGDSWHPNQAGHILTGQLLAGNLTQHFGQSPIQWKPLS